jgi:molybdate transport system substrate-binding protein
MGDSPEAIPARLARGETADVVILDAGVVDELGRKGLVRADTYRHGGACRVHKAEYWQR